MIKKTARDYRKTLRKLAGGARLPCANRHELIRTATVISKIFQIVLWLAAAAYVVVGVLAITGILGSAREADSLRHAYAAFGSMILIIGITSAAVTLLANKWRGWLILAPLILCLGLPVAFFGAFWIEMEKGDVHRRQIREESAPGDMTLGISRRFWPLHRQFQRMIRTRSAQPRRPFQICRRPPGTAQHCCVGPSGKRGSVPN